MWGQVSRRRFLGTTAASAAAYLGWPRLGRTWADTPLGELVRFEPELERLVRLIEDTPKQQCIDAVAAEVRAGLGERQLLAALLLAGLRNVNPQPPGFKFHCVMVIDACQQISLDLPPGERLMPLFYALGEFKDSQAADLREGDYVLRQPTATLGSAGQAREELLLAMDQFDGPRGDAAITTLVRAGEAGELWDLLLRWGSQDYRNIGHKIIFASQCHRLLGTIGRQHSEPVLRSLVCALVDFGRDRKLNGYAFEDQCYLANLALASENLERLPGDWAGERRDAGATRELWEVMRAGQRDEACRLAVEMLAGGRLGAAGVWDAVHLVGDELQTRQPGIFGIHAVTSKAGMHYAFRVAAQPQTRLLLLLQGVGWEGQFQRLITSSEGVGRGGPSTGPTLLERQPEPVSADPHEAAQQVLEALANDRASKDRAAALALGFGEQHPQSTALWSAARQILAAKGNDPHEFKFHLALAEDWHFVDPAWRARHQATLVYYLKGAGAPNSAWLDQARAALAG